MKSFLNDLRRMISKSLGEMVDDKRLRGLFGIILLAAGQGGNIRG